MSRRKLGGAMVTTLLASALILGSKASAQTQPVVVRSGEHEDFSRLVLQFPEEQEWSVRQSDTQYEIAFSPGDMLDLSDVFSWIPRTRIQDVSQNDETLALIVESQCECAFKVFSLQNNVVVIDLVDGEERVNQVEDVSTATTQTEPNEGTPVGELNWPVDTVLTEGRPFGILPGTGRGRVDFDRFGSVIERAQALDAEKDAVPATDALEQVEQGVSRAREAGLIDLAMGFDGDERSRSGAQNAGAGGDTPDHVENISIRTIFDNLSIGGPPDQPSDYCDGYDALAFMGEQSLLERLQAHSDRTRDVADARGIASVDGTRSLVENYLALTFGAEARLLIPSAAYSESYEATLLSLSAIVEEGSDDNEEVWGGVQACEGVQSLWGVLGHAPRRGAAPVNVAAVQQAYFGLPTYLRVHLGASLSKRLSELGHESAALSVESALRFLVDGAASAPGADAEVPEAAKGPVVQEGSDAQRISEFLEMLLSEMQREFEVPHEQVDAAEALATEYEDTKEGQRLNDIVAIGAFQEGQLGKGLELLQRSQADAKNDDWRLAVRRTVSHTLSSGSDVRMLSIVFDPRASELLDLVSSADLLEMSRRLLDAGFSAQALDVLAKRRLQATPEVDLVRAEAYLRSEDPRRALAMLAGRGDREAARLRGDALFELEEYASAAQAFALANRSEDAARAAWLSGEADVISEFGQGDVLEVAELLGRGRVVLEASLNDAPLRGGGPDAGAEGPFGTLSEQPDAPEDAAPERAGDEPPTGASISVENGLASLEAWDDLPGRAQIERAQALLDSSAAARDALELLESIASPDS